MHRQIHGRNDLKLSFKNITPSKSPARFVTCYFSLFYLFNFLIFFFGGRGDVLINITVILQCVYCAFLIKWYSYFRNYRWDHFLRIAAYNTACVLEETEWRQDCKTIHARSSRCFCIKSSGRYVILILNRQPILSGILCLKKQLLNREPSVFVLLKSFYSI